jgi:hypothetical protein
MPSPATTTPMHVDNPHARVGAACGARKRDGAPCTLPPITGRTRCRMHGGKTPAGAALPQFKTGKHSKYLPDRLAARYQDALDDGELLALRGDIALADARVFDLLERVDAGEPGALWQQVQRAFQTMQDAEDPSDRATAEATLGQLIEQGVGDFAAWADIARWVEQGRRLRETERKRLEAMQQTLTVEQAVALAAALAGIVQREVEDEATRDRIAAAIRRVVAGTDR